MIRLHLSTRPAGPAEVEATLARLDHEPGMYFGCDAGVPGLHPSRAVAFAAPALALHLHANGITPQALDAAGQHLLAMDELRAWTARALNAGQGAAHGSPHAQALRDFMGLFDPQARVMLCGALPFDAWRLQVPAQSRPAAGSQPSPAGSMPGIVYLPLDWWEREGDAWTRVELHLDAPLAVTAPQPASGLSHDRAATPPASDDFPPGGYADLVRRARSHLQGQGLVSLTLSQSFRRPCAASASAAFARLRAVNPAPASFLFNDSQGNRLFGASPDLQLLVHGRSVEAMPVCGTVARRPGPVGEADSLRELLNEDVDAASLAVCTDALRWDLAPLCEPGSLHLTDRRRPMSLATVVHTVDRLRGTLRDGADAWDAIFATTAPAMVTGAPRAQALAHIEALEASPRGWYGGLVVQVRADGHAMAGTILRAAWLRDAPGGTIAEVRTGGDLMADSDPQREEAESRLKAISLWRALGLEPVPGQPATPGQASQPSPPAHAPITASLQRGDDAPVDPFAPALRDCLLGLGMRLADTACGAAGDTGVVQVLSVAAGASQARAGTVALGDAAAAVLGQHGFAVRPIAPRHGRVQWAYPGADAPQELAGAGPVSVAIYETMMLEPGQRVPPHWQTWLVGNDGQPIMLFYSVKRIACLLFRPESLLSAPMARHALLLAMRHAQG